MEHRPTGYPLFSTTDWDEIWGSRQQIMLRLAAAGQRVLFVERQAGPEQLLATRPSSAARAAWRVRPCARQANLWLWQQPLLRPGAGRPAAGRHRTAHPGCPPGSPCACWGSTHPLLWLYPPQSAALLGQFDERLPSITASNACRRPIETQAPSNAGPGGGPARSGVDLVFTHSEGCAACTPCSPGGR